MVYTKSQEKFEKGFHDINTSKIPLFFLNLNLTHKDSIATYLLIIKTHSTEPLLRSIAAIKAALTLRLCLAKLC